MFKHILVPTDGSELSTLTVTRAVNFAYEAGAKITFLYVQPGYPMPMLGEGALIAPIGPEEFARAARHEADRILQLAESTAKKTGVESNSATEVSDLPYEQIIKTADQNGCDLIFMASHGRKGLASLLLGSETQKVLTHSKIPVLVYR